MQTVFKESKHFVTKIFKSPSRFASDAEVTRVKISPSPSAYNLAEAYEHANSPRGKLKLGKDKRKCFVDTEAKLIHSPGPTQHSMPISSLNWLTNGLGSSRKRI